MQWDDLAQHALDGLVLGLAVALAAGGLVVVRSVARVTTVAQPDIGVAAAAMVLLLSTVGVRWLSAAPLVGSDGRLPLGVAVPVAIAAMGGLGWLFERVVWRPLQRARSGTATTLVASVALVVVVRSALRLALGDASRDLLGPGHLEWTAGSFRVSPIVAVGIACGLLAMAVLARLLGRGDMAVRFRAVADDPMLAASTGVDPALAARTAWVLATALAAGGGVLLALQHGLTADLADETFVAVLVAGFVGRLGAIGRVVGVSVALGLVTEFLAADLGGVSVPREVTGLVALAALLAAVMRRGSEGS